MSKVEALIALLLSGFSEAEMSRMVARLCSSAAFDLRPGVTAREHARQVAYIALAVSTPQEITEWIRAERPHWAADPANVNKYKSTLATWLERIA